MTKHLKQAKHIKNMAKQSEKEEDVIQHTGAEESILGKFRALGTKESADFWQRKKDRQVKKNKENTRPRDGPGDKSTEKGPSAKRNKENTRPCDGPGDKSASKDPTAQKKKEDIRPREDQVGESSKKDLSQAREPVKIVNTTPKAHVEDTLSRDTVVEAPPVTTTSGIPPCSSESRSTLSTISSPGSSKSLRALSATHKPITEESLFGSISDSEDSDTDKKASNKRKRKSSPEGPPTKKSKDSCTVPQEGDFVPDYEEEVRSQAASESTSFQPSATAAGLCSVTHQLILQNKNLVGYHEGIDRMNRQLVDALRRMSDNTLGKDLLVGVRGQMQMLNENMSANHRELVTLHNSVDRLATAVRGFSSMMESSVGGVTTALNVFTGMMQDKSAGTKNTDNNGEEKWVKQKENGHRHLQERRNQYPYHHSPLDAAMSTPSSPKPTRSYSRHSETYHHGHHSSSATHPQARHRETRAISVSREIQQKYRKAFVYHNCFKGLRR